MVGILSGSVGIWSGSGRDLTGSVGIWSVLVGFKSGSGRDFVGICRDLVGICHDVSGYTVSEDLISLTFLSRARLKSLIDLKI